MAIKVPSPAVKVTTTVTTGAIATHVSLTPSLITDWTTRFACFDEYRVTHIAVEFRCFSSINPGVIRAWLEEKSTATPTAALAAVNRGITFPASAVERTHMLKWQATDYGDAEYTSMSGIAGTVYLKIYTDNAVFGSSTVATDYLAYKVQFTVQFRGMQ